MDGMHLALRILVAFSLLGAAVSSLRGPHVSHDSERVPVGEPRPAAGGGRA